MREQRPFHDWVPPVPTTFIFDDDWVRPDYSTTFIFGESLALPVRLSPLLLLATPKTIMRTMGVKGFTLYHLKSHIQFYYLVKGAQMSTGATVAVKVLATDSRQGEKEFQSEVSGY
ncbi:hypothetical protein RHGRI_034709 [Rhododendron griersonianum]|uniref:Uncharacterized protein n=1 Tax=Rhododendron griersonianum TaxID=479676 RepID=A0AAV6I2C8_9ERIC|nr:hypothetical protein RHGRI_034709 [Rhododendron griersonianum]